jgi:hypothetical protein
MPLAFNTSSMRISEIVSATKMSENVLSPQSFNSCRNDEAGKGDLQRTFIRKESDQMNLMTIQINGLPKS